MALAAGAIQLVFKSVGDDADAPVGTLEVSINQVGETKSRIATQGRPDGVVAVTAINVGDVAADGSAVPVRITDSCLVG